MRGWLSTRGVRAIMAVSLSSVAASQLATAQTTPPARTASDGELQALRYSISVREMEQQRLTTDGPQTSYEKSQLDTLERDGPSRLAALRAGIEPKIEQARQDALRRHRETHARLDREAEDLRTRYEQRSKQLETARNTRPATQNLEADIATARAELAALRIEMRRVIEDLKTGMFCSECGRSRYELEHDQDPETFAQHLRRVNGHPVMNEDKIRAKESEYAQQVAGMTGKVGQLTARLQSVRARHAADLVRQEADFTRFAADYEAKTANIQSGRNAADNQRRLSLEALPDRRRELEAEVAKAEADHARKLDDLRESIGDKEAEHAEKLAEVTTSLDRMRELEGIMLEQANYRDPVDSPAAQHAVAVMRRLDAMESGPSTAEILGDQDYAKYREAQRLWQLRREALRENGALGANDSARELAEMAKFYLDKLGFATEEPVRRQVEAWLRARFIEQRRVELGLQPDPRPCFDLPPDNVCHRTNPPASRP